MSLTLHRAELDGLHPSSFNLPSDAHNRGALLFDTDGRLASADTTVFQMLGLSSDDITAQATAEDVRRLLSERMADPEAYTVSYSPLREYPHAVLEDVFDVAGTERRAVHRYSAPLFDMGGDYAGRVEVYSDITKRRALEEAAVRAYEQLREAQEQLVQSEKLRAVGEIASGVAHDFNNTLGVVLGNIQLLLRSNQDEKTTARLKAAERAALDGIETVRRIREFTRMAPGREPKPIDLNQVVSEAIEMMKPAWQDGPRKRGIEVEIDLDLAPRAFSLGNASEIREVLVNVLLNAVQAMPEGGRITVSTAVSETETRVTLADTGIGMTEDVRSRVFDPFFTTRGVEGSGLGMSVAHGIVRRHNGRIAVESEIGKGTTVSICLPVCEGAVSERENEAICEDELPARARILVVDDEEMYAEVLVEMLGECGHYAAVARSGAEAIEMFRDGDFDIVMTDLGMPRMSGAEVAEAVKRVKPDTPVALLTGWGEGLAGDLSQLSVDVVLSKPISLEKLSAAVAEALAARRRV